MSRGGKLAGFVSAICASLVLSPAALADVLEISGDTSVWIARGASGSRPVEVGRQQANQNPGETIAAPSAGPAQWTAHIARLAVRYDLSPSLLEALVWQESRWNPHAVSPVGAKGLAQLMPGTARDMQVNPDDPLANLEGGARYLRLMLNMFGGDLEKALAAYNAGPARVAKANGIPRIRETQNYVSAIMGRLSLPVRR
jgi:soluble lytic murein transglycosylase-like protein